MKATEQFFPAVMFTILYKVVLTFEPELLSSVTTLLSSASLGDVDFYFRKFQHSISTSILRFSKEVTSENKSN